MSSKRDVQPTDEDILNEIEELDNVDVPTDKRMLWFEGKWYGDVQPIPNCPDGRYRDESRT